MIATYQDMVSNKTFENLIKNVISVITKLGELVNSIGLAKIVFIAFSAIMYKLGSLVLPIVTKQLIAFGTSFLLITDNIAMFPSMIKNISFALMSGGGLTGALTAAETALLSFGSMLGGLAIAAAVVGITYAVMNYKTAAEKAKEAVEEFSDAEKEHKQTSEDLSAQLDENIAKYEELAKVKSLGNISDKQQEELSNLEQTNELLKKQIAYEDTLARIAKNSKQEAAKKALEGAMFDTGIEDNARNNAITGKAGMSSNTRKVNIENMGAEVKATAEEYAELIAEAYQKGDEKAVERLKAEAKAYQGKVAEFDYSGYVESLDKTSEEYKNLMGNTEDVNYGTTMLEIVLGSAGLSMEEYALATDEATVASEELASATEKLDTMSTIFAIATDAMNTLKSAQNELSESNSLSWGTIQGLITAYPALKNKLYGYMQGVVSNTEMVDLLTKAYSDQETTVEDNLNSSKDYYNTMILGNSEMYQKFLNDYNIDLTNFTNLNELKTSLQQQMAIDSTQEEADRVDSLAESYNVDLSNFGSVIEKKIEMQRQLTLLIDQERAKQATKLSEIAAKTGAYVPAGYAKDSAQSVAYKEALKELGPIGVDQSVYDSIINNVKNLASGISAKSLSEGADSSSGSDSEAAWNDITQAIVDAINQQSILDAKQSDVIQSQISIAESAEDYAKQIELQNQLLNNQMKTVEDLRKANEQIHSEADKIRKTTSYDTMSWFNADGSDTVAYLNLFNSLTKDEQEKLATIHDQLKTLKDAWSANNDEITTINQSISETNSKISEVNKSLLQEQKDALQEILDLTVEMIEKETDDQIDALNDQIDAYGEIIDAKKEALELAKEEAEYAEEVADKQKTVSDIEDQIVELSYDNSLSAQAKKLALEEELADAKEELSDYQADRSLEIQEDALDEELENYTDEKNDEIDVLEDYLSNQQQLLNDAMEMMDDNASSLYKKLTTYSEIYGSSIDDLAASWETAIGALSNYASAKAAMEGITSGLNSDSGTSSSTAASRSSIGFGSFSDSDWATYKYNKKLYAYSLDEATRKQAAIDNAAMRKKYGITSDKYSYEDIKGYYATGTTSASGGLAMVGENGAELRVLNQGDGIIPNGLTETLMSFAQNPLGFMSGLLYSSTPSTSATSSASSSTTFGDFNFEITASSTDTAKDIAKEVMSQINSTMTARGVKRTVGSFGQ